MTTHLIYKTSRQTLRRLLSVAVTLFALVGLVSCGEKESLTIASHIWPGYEFMFLARDEGRLPKEVTLVETADASNSLQALKSGKVVGAALTLDEVLRARSEGVPLTIVLVFNVSAGADVVLAVDSIKRLSDLRGKRIGAETSATGALMLAKLLEAAGLKRSDVTVIPLAIDDQAAAFRQKTIDALITYEPVATQLLANGGHRIFDSRQIPETIIDVLAVRTDRLTTLRSGLNGLIEAHFTAQQMMRRNPQDVSYRLAKRLGMSGQETLAAFRGLNLPTLDANRSMLAPGQSGGLVSGTGRVAEAARFINITMVDAGLLKQQDDLKDLTSPDFLPTGDLR